MRGKISIVLLVITLAFFSVFYICRTYYTTPDKEKNTSSIVIPKTESDKLENSSEASINMDDTAVTSLIPLKTTETLVSIVSLDFNDDGYDDQINAIKTAGSPFISLLVGLYNPNTQRYERSSVISTEISQIQSFSYTGLDITGAHRTALVYQGFADNGDSILQAYHISNKNRLVIKKIADLRGDGTIFIQQLTRYDAYERSNAKGSSFPIWVYSSDTEKNTTDQLQIRFEWNENQGEYTQSQIIRVAGSKIAAKELAKIQDGTVKTFAQFLNGLWIRPEDEKNSTRNVFFDYENKEIIFLIEDTEEIYKWVHSTIRRNGIYITAINQQIENLQRRIDISLKAIDEIQIRIQDDVRMLISESTIWDGSYTKMPQNASLYVQKSQEKKNTVGISMESEPLWKTRDASGISASFKNGKYNIFSESMSETGSYTEYTIQDMPFIQLRASSNPRWFEQLYKIESKTENNSKDKIITLIPFKAQGDGIYPLEKKKFTFIPSNEHN